MTCERVPDRKTSDGSPAGVPAEIGAHPLALYDAACRAVAEVKSIDEAKHIVDMAAAMAVYARKAKNKDLEEDAIEMRLQATRRLDQLRQAQKQAVGLNQGAVPGKTGLRGNPVLDARPTLASQGVDKNLAHQARVLGKLSEEEFKAVVAEGRASVSRTMQRVVNAVALEQEREAYRARTYTGGTIDDLVALAASGYRAGVIVPDPPWPFEVYSVQGRQRSPDRHYDTMTIDAIKALPVAPLAADDCVLPIWGTWPDLPAVLEVIKAWGFEYKTLLFEWVKTTTQAEAITLDGDGLHWGMGFATRANTEPCLLATRGNPLRLAADVHQVIVAPVGKHSEKPDAAYARIERLYGGPRLELFARKPRERWCVWGDEIPRADSDAANNDRISWEQ